MKKISLFIYVLFVCMSCNTNDNKIKTENNNSKIINSDCGLNKVNFEKYLENFKDISILDKNILYDKFYDCMNEEYEKKIIAIPKNEQNLYLREINFKNIYYGFKAKLKDKNWIVIYYQHSDEPLKIVDNTDEIAYFKACIYDECGTYMSNFDIMGADIPDFDPVYNLESNFYYKGDNLYVNTKEVYYDINQTPINDTIVSGTIKDNTFLYKENKKFVLMKSNSKPAKLTIAVNKQELACIVLAE